MSFGDTKLDAWNYTLFTVESITNVAFIPITFILCYICITQMNLHVNFRSALFLTTAGHLLCAIQRIMVVTVRMCCIAKRDTSLTSDLVILLMTGELASVFGWLLVVVDRAFASAYPSFHDKRCAGYTVSIVLSSIAVLLTALLMFIYGYRLINNFDFYFMGVQTVVTLACFLALVAVIKCNVIAYRRRHDGMLSLNDRYHLDENIRCGKYLIPVAVNDVLCRVVIILLMVYSTMFTVVPLGHDTSHLSHGYDLTTAYQRTFFGLALTLRSQKFDHLLKRGKRCTRVVNLQAEAASAYYKEMRRMWA